MNVLEVLNRDTYYINNLNTKSGQKLDNLHLKNVWFKYLSNDKYALANINLNINKGDRLE